MFLSSDQCVPGVSRRVWGEIGTNSNTGLSSKNGDSPLYTGRMATLFIGKRSGSKTIQMGRYSNDANRCETDRRGNRCCQQHDDEAAISKTFTIAKIGG
ncbi:hypothetical protein AVEN_46512-1 [Araneus ventricosus]|uniref:Uncharacterized protein n=1 Tax=Araneus ventricosus TaxID=182803 RepID=A0A4Y2HBN2_ARAVE|nr:hypothetical protein AVEN_46512-1 [Araneus ventricosus]